MSSIYESYMQIFRHLASYLQKTHVFAYTDEFVGRDSAIMYNRFEQPLKHYRFCSNFGKIFFCDAF